MGATLSTLRAGETITVEATPLNQDNGNAYASTAFWGPVSDINGVTVTAPSVTPSVVNTMILLVGHVAAAGVGVGTAGVFSGSEPPVERLDANTSLGIDAGIFADTFVKAAAAATGARTSTYSVTVHHLGVTVGLLPNGTPSFVATGSVAAVASGNMTPGEPAGATTDDILVCVIEQRDNVVATMSSDWTAVYAVNTRRDVGSEARASMFWCRRGGSAPSYLITRAGGDAGIAAVMAIRSCTATGSPIDRVAMSGAIDVVQSISNSKQALVTGEFPGTDTIRYDFNDILGNLHTQLQAVTVIDADHVTFSVSPLVFFPDDLSTDPVQIQVTAYARDSRQGNKLDQPYVLIDPTWAIDSATPEFIKFSVGGAVTATGTTITVTAVAAGTDSITVTARNRQGQTITGNLSVKVLAAATAPITIA